MADHTSNAQTLPPQPTPFVGREAEVAELASMLADPAFRLLTLVGPGGIGKTRLAIEVVSRASDSVLDNVRFVDLQPVLSPEFLVSAIADALGYPLTGHGEPRRQILTYLRDKELLLLLDNFEHLLDGANLLPDILAAAPGVRLLTTSREALNLREEFRYQVQGLETPADTASTPPERCDAVRLFAERARRVRRGFDIRLERTGVAQVCRLVDGMPLALELAAAWTRTMSCEAIAAEIRRSLELLSTGLRDVPKRHRSVRAAFDGSWATLTEQEQDGFTRLSVFRGGIQRQAAEQVAGTSLQVLASLVDRSLLRYEPDGKYRMHELLRQYAAEKLGESPQGAEHARDRHREYFIDFLASRSEAINGGGQRQAVIDIASEVDNVRAAWDRAVEQGDVDSIARAVLVLYWFHDIRGAYAESVALLEQAVVSLRGVSPARDTEFALTLVYTGWSYIRLGRLDEAGAALEESLRLHAELGVPPQPGLATDPLLGLGVLALVRGQYQEAEVLGAEAKRRSEEQGHAKNLPYAWYVLTNAALAQGRYEDARNYASRAYAAVRDSQDRWFEAYCLNDLGDVACALGDYDEAHRYYEAGYAMREEFGDPEGMAVALNRLGKVALLRGDYSEARALYERGAAIYREIGDRGGLARSLQGLGVAQCASGNYESAGRHLGQALDVAAGIRFLPLVVAIIASAGELLLRAGQTSRGLELLSVAAGHPLGEREPRDRARRLLEEFQKSADADIVGDTARAREYADLDAIVADLQMELSAPTRWAVSAPIGPDGQRAARRPEQPLADPLTERELEVLRLIAEGRSNREIADELFLTLGTVKWYGTQIYSKLGADGRTRAVARARELGLVP
ncbi:MAG: tetratricopeptide repeat protein [Chloroflexota bacterium]|nr:tetratricopeptide repeat protein [Chloroflexota bacterium]